MKSDTPITDKIYSDYLSDPYQDTGDKAAIMHIQCEKFERDLAEMTKQRNILLETLTDVDLYLEEINFPKEGFIRGYIGDNVECVGYKPNKTTDI